MGNMYAGAKSWSPFRGCEFDCTYCVPTFQRQAKRQLHNCRACYDYTPHEHPERLSKIPRADIIFVAASGDLAFARPSFVAQIIDAIIAKNANAPDQIYYLQSKQPECFAEHLWKLPSNVTLVTTLETNRDQGYSAVSKAPPPTVRAAQFRALDHPRKVITVEPLIDFDLVPFADLIADIEPEYVWIGFNSRPKQVQLLEPSLDRVRSLIDEIRGAGIEVRGKTLRGIVI